jgi:four helix bundle protein
LAKQLSLDVYRITLAFPHDEKYGLTSQLRRATVSVMSNVAEGAARRTTRDYVGFLYRARASLEEVDAQLELAGDLALLKGVDVNPARDTFDNLSRALQGLINALEEKIGRR